jgi:acetyltransferase-like isoleucine patch superfamily enzyme
MRQKKLIYSIHLWYLLKKNKGLKLGTNVFIDYRSKLLLSQNKLILGDNVTIQSNPHSYHAGMPFPTCIFIDIQGAYVIIGDNSRLNGVYIHAQKAISIGENCVIAAGVNIIDSNGHQVHSRNRTIGRDTPLEIVIGNNVWIGLNSIILKGTKIGSNSIVSAGSVVKGDFPENSIIAGNPASIIGQIRI